ncbi:unnamed protein product [Nezara viridula]|uniref:Uncharacterized protein n=1 Tax=Nezara viridula TaxID=85310 RepID=A0A9P0HQE8_NEZVI|nr:unnamed protein product [Nezara viridula]
MSDLGRTEAVKKLPKKKKKEGEVLSKQIAGKSPTQKKPKKKSDVEEVPQDSAPPQPSAEDVNMPESSNVVKDTIEQEVKLDNSEDQKVNSEPSKPQPVEEGPLEKESTEVENEKKVGDVNEEVNNTIEEMRKKIGEVRVIESIEEDKAIVVHTPSKSAQYKVRSF